MSTVTGTSSNDSWALTGYYNGTLDGLGGVDTLSIGTLTRSQFTLTQNTDGSITLDTVAGASGTAASHIVMSNMEIISYNNQSAQIYLGVSAANVATVAANTKVTSIYVTDTSANLAANLNVIEANVAKISTITQSGTVSALVLAANQLMADTDALGKISGTYSIAITDTSANIAANLDVLQANAAKISTITQSGTVAPLAITATQLTTDAAALGKITGTYTLALSTNQIVALSSTQVGALTASQVAALTTAQIAAIETADLVALSSSGIAALNTADLRSLNTDQISVLTTRQIAALNTAAIKVLSTDQIVALNSTQVGALTASQVAVLTTAQVAAIETADLVALSSSGIAALNTADIRSLSTDQISVLTTRQIAALNTAAIKVLSTAQIVALNSTQIGALTASQVAVLTTAQVAAIETADLAALSSSGIAALNTADIRSLSTDQISVLTTRQIAALNTAAIKVLRTDQLHALSSTQDMALTTTQIQKLTTTQAGSLAGTYNSGTGLYTPIVLDLNGDGVSSLSISAEVQFDLHANGQKVHTGWVSSSDGLLTLDRNHDGLVNDGSELFGSSVTLANGQKANDGYAALRELDSNSDNSITKSDTQWANLKVWVDKNSDGISQVDEIQTLDSLGITKLDLTAQTASLNDNGNVIGLTSSYQISDGTNHAMADVWFLAEKVRNLTHAISSFDTAVVNTASSMINLLSDSQLPSGNVSGIITVLNQFDANGNLITNPVQASSSAQTCITGASLLANDLIKTGFLVS
ncbi:MAG: beta strand repeat-containing protein [Candidatus Saccharimonadales bacterium]